MDKNVLQLYQEHKSMFENWTYGEPVKSWKDKDGNTCIKYESGKWFHYRKNNNFLEFW